MGRCAHLLGPSGTKGRFRDEPLLGFANKLPICGVEDARWSGRFVPWPGGAPLSVSARRAHRERLAQRIVDGAARGHGCDQGEAGIDSGDAKREGANETVGGHLVVLEAIDLNSLIKPTA